jgi:hypothetical protein
MLRHWLDATGIHHLKLYATLANTPEWAGPCQSCMPNSVWDDALLFQFAGMARDNANPAARLGAPDLSVGGLGPLIFLDSVMSTIRPYFREHGVLTFHWYPDQCSCTTSGTHRPTARRIS